jgi:hypothetical protein
MSMFQKVLVRGSLASTALVVFANLAGAGVKLVKGQSLYIPSYGNIVY